MNIFLTGEEIIRENYRRYYRTKKFRLKEKRVEKFHCCLLVFAAFKGIRSQNVLLSDVVIRRAIQSIYLLVERRSL